MNSIKVVSSLDSHFAVAETFRNELINANKICMCYPWYGSSFVHLMKTSIPKGAFIDLLTRTPSSHDGTFRALEALEAVSREMQWKLSIICVPNLHAKFAIINNEDVLFGTANPTSSGTYYNVETLMGFYKMPNITKRFWDMFECIKRQEQNQRWEEIPLHTPNSNYPNYAYTKRSTVRPSNKLLDPQDFQKKIAEKAIGYFLKNGNNAVHKWKLYNYLKRSGIDDYYARNTIQNLILDGILYEPKRDMIRLVNSRWLQ